MRYCNNAAADPAVWRLTYVIFQQRLLQSYPAWTLLVDISVVGYFPEDTMHVY